MAEEESTENQEEEGDEQQGDSLDIGEPKVEKKSNKITFIIIGVVVLLIVIISAVLAIVLTSGKDEHKITGSAEEVEYIVKYEKRKQKTLAPIKEPIFTDFFNYDVNMADGRHYVHLTMKLVFQDPLAKIFLDARIPLVDDRMISLLKKLKLEEMQTRSGMVLLKRKIFKEMNQIFIQAYIDQSESKDRTPVKQVLITNFFIQ